MYKNYYDTPWIFGNKDFKFETVTLENTQCDVKEASEVIKDKLLEYLEECYDECIEYSEEVIDVYISLIKEFKKDENK